MKWNLSDLLLLHTYHHSVNVGHMPFESSNWQPKSFVFATVQASHWVSNTSLVSHYDIQVIQLVAGDIIKKWVFPGLKNWRKIHST